MTTRDNNWIKKPSTLRKFNVHFSSFNGDLFQEGHYCHIILTCEESYDFFQIWLREGMRRDTQWNLNFITGIAFEMVQLVASLVRVGYISQVGYMAHGPLLYFHPWSQKSLFKLEGYIFLVLARISTINITCNEMC